MSISSATETIIIIPVALNAEIKPLTSVGLIALKISDGTTVKNARKSAPKNVIHLLILAKYSVVVLPGLIPGMNPPFD